MLIFWVSLFIIGFGLAWLTYRWACRVQMMAVVDLIWTFGLGLGAVAYLFFSGVSTPLGYTVCLLILLWSLRLSYHLFSDRVLKGQEDPRYASLAEFWGKDAKRNFLGLFLVQVVFVALFLWPVSVAIDSAEMGWMWTDWLAIAIALVAMVGESLADRQLADFRKKASNRGQVCQHGLWRYSRHPNYFFEWLHWWAYVAFAWGCDGWWVTLLGPVAMYVFLRYLTGIPHAERSSLKSRGEAYRQYQLTTSAFFPWLPHEPQS